MDIRLGQISDLAQETDKAKTYWATSDTQRYAAGIGPYYTAAIAEIVGLLGCRRIFEFGCGDGRNLHALREAVQLAEDGALVLTGTDPNEALVASGRERLGITIFHGDEARLQEFANDEFELSFTISALAHLPSPKSALIELLRVTKSVLLMLEPAYETGGHGSERIEVISTQGGGDRQIETTPFTYIHDYQMLAREAGAEVNCTLPFPSDLSIDGSLYRLHIISKPNSAIGRNADEIRDAVVQVSLLHLQKTVKENHERSEHFQSEVQSLQSEIAKLQFELRETSTNITTLEERESKDGSISVYDYGRIIAALERQVEELDQKLTNTKLKIRSGLEYRWGTTLVRERRRFWAWPLLPLKLYHAYKGFLTVQKEFDAQRNAEAHSARSNILAALREGPRERTVEPIENRVCYVLHNSLPYASGGYATRGHGLAKGLVAQGMEVIALTRPGFPADTKEMKLGEVADHVIDGVQYRRIHFPWRKLKPTVQYMQEIIPEFEAVFRELRPSIVIGASFYISAMPAMIAARRLGIPFIYELRGLAEITKISREPSYAHSPAFAEQVLMETETGKNADHMFTLTQAMREESIRRGIEGDKITLLPNSCDPEQFSAMARDPDLARRYGFPEGIPVIGYIGSIVDYEGLDDLIAACALLKKRGIEFRILIVGSETATGGPGVVTSQIMAVAKEAGLGDWLVMPGRVPHHEVQAHYSLIDIAPFPRKAWPVCEMVSPMKPLEAFAMEKAVVVSSVSALAEMVKDNETGLIFRKEDVGSLADALERLISDSALRLRLGKAARHFVERERTWRRTASLAMNVIRSLTSKSVRQEDQA